MSEKRSIPVRILGQEYRVRSDAGEDTVRGAATLVDETMQRIQQRTGTVDTRDLAVLAALNLANRVVSAGRMPVATQDASGDGRLQALIELVESEIENDAAVL
jgi:cell division protein ZapA (FtsZ GTPase activity inhibitor)